MEVPRTNRLPSVFQSTEAELPKNDVTDSYRAQCDQDPLLLAPIAWAAVAGVLEIGQAPARTVTPDSHCMLSGLSCHVLCWVFAAPQLNCSVAPCWSADVNALDAAPDRPRLANRRLCTDLKFNLYYPWVTFRAAPSSLSHAYHRSNLLTPSDRRSSDLRFCEHCLYSERESEMGNLLPVGHLLSALGSVTISIGSWVVSSNGQ